MRFIYPTSLGGGGATTLQIAYNNSSNPQFTTSPAKGAVAFKGGTGVDTDNIVEGKNNANAVTSFIKANGESSFETKSDGLKSGGTITIGTYGGAGVDNDARVAPATWYISPTTYSTVADTDFLDIALSAAGLQRYIGFYGDNTNTITKVEGTESEYASLPATPVGTVVIGYILVSDSGSVSSPDLSAYALINPRVLSIASSLIPTYNVANYDVLNITALAGNIPSMTTNLTGIPGNFKSFIVRFKDNGTARTITWGAKFAAWYAALPTTTIIGKTLEVGFRYDTSTGVYKCYVYSYTL